MVADFVDHNRSVGFFTIVAANNVFGSQCLVIGGLVRVALALWIVGIALWAALTYAIFTALTIKRQKPSLGDGIHGGWLVAVVAGQSVVVLGARVALSTHAEAALFFCFAMWLGGAMLYLWIIGLIFYRYTFFVLSPSDLAPPYWINMGAAAITALAGSTLILASPSSTVLRDALPFVRGFTLLWWSTATWWIPMLFMLGLWRYALCRFPLRYDPLYWGAVFPLGMYTACTIGVSTALGAPYLMVIPRFFFYLAFVAWSVTMLGLIASAVRRDSSAAKSASSAGAP
jgi:tellurite resistance protein TehA-like permease